MSDPIATYTFLPWLRSGVAAKIATVDLDATIKLRATVKVDLQLDAQKLDGSTQQEIISRDIQLYGPGDIVGIDSTAIVKVEPHNWITNFESNYLPYVEFYDEDFPWRYTPAAPDVIKDRLRPWLTLVVLKDADFKEAKNIQDKPLPYILVDDAANLFPPAEELWAWAHVHVNVPLMTNIVANPSEKPAVLSGIESLITNDPDKASSRLLCPVKLEANQSYHAFLIPTFETGRMAGLAMNMATDKIAPEVHATFSAWGNYPNKPDPTAFPVYHRWYFRTGSVGDFEYLVRLLEPKPVDSRVGRKDIDVQYPGSNINGILDPALDGVLKLMGSLQVPFDTMKLEDQQVATRYDEWDLDSYPKPFQTDLAAFINLGTDYITNNAADANAATNLAPAIKEDCDPMITAPLYGRWHALVDRLLKESDGATLPNNQNWIHQLNLDPRWRTAAGYGTRVIQQNQENYMTAAWSQVGDVLEANRKMRLAQMAKLISASIHIKQVLPMIRSDEGKAMFFLAPVQTRVINGEHTVLHQLDLSPVSRSATSVNMRKFIRPGGKIMKKMRQRGFVPTTSLVTRLNNGEIRIAAPPAMPEALPTLDKLGEQLVPTHIPPAAVDILRRYRWLKWLLLAIAVILMLILLAGSLSGIAIAGLGAAAAAFIAAFIVARRWQAALDLADSIGESGQTAASVDALPMSPDFHLSQIGDTYVPATGAADSAEATRYKTALRDALQTVEMSGEAGKVLPKIKVDLQGMVNVTFGAIDPHLTFPRLIGRQILLPDRIRNAMQEQFTEAMAYPVIDEPMYKPLTKISSELFLPNINFIGQNTISLLETNQRFIESYMVGLNHEFSRELLWREYPTDQRGSYFRQFWEVNGVYDPTAADAEALKEKLRDIPPLHRWSKTSKLGDHDHRETGGAKEEEIVLVIRGELLKKYPNAVIYAQRAEWDLNEDGTINNKVERHLVELTVAEKENPPRDKFKTPLYEAKVDPDIYFFGFDLTALDAKGETGESPEDINKAGWFFCIKERPGEPRFGLDINEDPTPNVWNDLSWKNVAPGAAGSFIRINDSTASIALQPLGIDDEEKEEQRLDDNSLSWNKQMNAAEVAYIMYQVPVLVAVHATEMLPK